LLEEDSNIRHEFFEGEIYAMAGGTPQHAALAAAITGELHRQLEGKPCRAYSADLRVRVMATGLGTYPDVTVVCGPVQSNPGDPNTCVNPSVVVEILSDSTEAYDRSEKLANYWQIPSLKTCVLVSHREQLVEVFSPGADGKWYRVEARTHAVAKLEAIGCELSVDRLYAGLEFQDGG
jgi:Uma2 family endonuclease